MHLVLIHAQALPAFTLIISRPLRELAYMSVWQSSDATSTITTGASEDVAFYRRGSCEDDEMER